MPEETTSYQEDALKRRSYLEMVYSDLQEVSGRLASEFEAIEPEHLTLSKEVGKLQGRLHDLEGRLNFLNDRRAEIIDERTAIHNRCSLIESDIKAITKIIE